MMSVEPHISPITIISNEIRPVMDGTKIVSLLLRRDVAGLGDLDVSLVQSIPVYGGACGTKIVKRWYDIKDVEMWHRENLRKDPDDKWAATCLETIRILKIHVAQFNFQRIEKEIVDHELSLD